MKQTAATILAVVGMLALTGATQAVTIDWVTVGNPGNAADTTGYGSVSTTYRIGMYEVTNAQYIEFLNAKAATNGDVLALYNTSMSSGVQGGITRAGIGTSASPYVYTVKSGRGNNPVTYVSFYDTLRFANWLNNGQGAGDTETGAYTLLGGTPTPNNGAPVTRNVGATVFLPSENEWYKAAYHDKAAGIAGTYFDYATGTNTPPYSDNPSTLNTPDNSNVANFFKNDNAVNDYDGGYAVSGSATFTNGHELTDVGAYALAASPYGTFDQMGNLWEWNEAIFVSNRGRRGGSWNTAFATLAADPGMGSLSPTGTDSNQSGFRVASAVPEPGTMGLLGIGAVLLAYRRRFRKSTL